MRTQAEHFSHLIPLVQDRYTVYALDLPGMGYSQIVPGASYEEPAMRAAVKAFMTRLDLRDATLLGESMGAVLALTTAADLPERVRLVVAVNPYGYAGGSRPAERGDRREAAGRPNADPGAHSVSAAVQAHRPPTLNSVPL